MATDEPPPHLTDWELERWDEGLIYDEVMEKVIELDQSE